MQTLIVNRGNLTYTRFFYQSVWSDWACTSGVDSILVEGTSGDWNYILFANGFAICEYSKKATATETLVSSLDGFRTSINAYSYPFCFADEPSFSSTVQDAGGGNWAMTTYTSSPSGTDLKATTPQIFGWRPTQPSDDVVVKTSIVAMGRWK